MGPHIIMRTRPPQSDWASYFEADRKLRRILRAEAADYARRLEAALPLGGRERVLDFGCGPGLVAQELAPKVGELFLWDAAANVREQARINAAGRANVKFLEAPPPESFPPDLRFDLILVNSVAQYMTAGRFSSWLAEWRAMLGPSGRLVISDLVPLETRSLPEIAALLLFSARHRLLMRALWDSPREFTRYARVRRAHPLYRLGREDFRRRAAAAGLAVEFLPDNLTYRRRRFAAVLTRAENGGASFTAGTSRPLVSLVVPAYNEAAIVEKHLAAIRQYMTALEKEWRWELIFVDDGSADETGRLAESFARTADNIHILRHGENFGLGRALRSGFARSRGDYVVALDLDLSYSLDHVEKLLAKIRATGAALVIASPYAERGEVANVPRRRRALSRWANRFLSLAAGGRIATLTGMVRAYDGAFLRSLDLTATGAEINPEIVYRAIRRRARIEEIPARLDWGERKAERAARGSGRSALRQTATVFYFGWLFLKETRCPGRSAAK